MATPKLKGWDYIAPHFKKAKAMIVAGHANVPTAIQLCKAWVIWRMTYITRDETHGRWKFNKMPYYPTTSELRNGPQGSDADRAKLGTYNAALIAAGVLANGSSTPRPSNVAGIGLAMLPDLCLVAFDADSCIDAEGNISPEVLALTDGTYTEISPSGTGIRAFWSGTARNGANHTKHFELYSEKQFVTVTGNQVDNTYKLLGGALPLLDDELRTKLETLCTADKKGKERAANGERVAAPPSSEVPAQTVTELRSALLSMRSDDRDVWVSMGHALKALGDVGRGLWLDWSATSEKFDPADAAQVWDSFNPSHTGYQAVFAKAQRGGWLNPASRAARVMQDDPLEGFEVLVDELPEDRRVTTPVAFHVPRLVGTDARDGTRLARPLTEHGNALRLYDANGDRLRYCPEVKAWLVWNGAAWTWSADGAKVREAAAHLARSIYREGMHASMQDAQYYACWAKHSQKKNVIAASVALLSDMGALRAPIASIDAEHFIAGFDQARQVIDLTTGTARPAIQSDFVTKALGAATIGNAVEAVRWRQFLCEIFDNDLELIDWMQRFCGYLLTGSTREHIFLFCYGLGANGKSIFLETLNHIMGDYSRAISSATLADVKRQSGAASPDLAGLVGARLALCSETEEGQPLAESLVKSMVSGDTMRVRPLYSEGFDTVPNFKLLMAGNHRPVIKGTDHGIWRRVRLAPFNQTFGKEKRDPRLLDKLKAETPHILAWMIDGCQAWQQRSLADTPACVERATGQYQADQDLTGRWLDECTTADAKGEAGTGAIYASYKAWSEVNGLRPASNVALGRRLSERGFVQCRNRRGRFWGGLLLNDLNADFLGVSV